MKHNGKPVQDVVLEQKTLPVHNISIVEQIVTLELKNTFIGTVLVKQKHITPNPLKQPIVHVKLLKLMVI